MANRPFSTSELEKLISTGKVGPFHDFRSKTGKPFAATVRLTPALNLEFDFGQCKMEASATSWEWQAEPTDAPNAAIALGCMLGILGAAPVILVVLRKMKHICTFSAFFIVLMVVFLVHTDSNLWIVYPDRMVLKDRATPFEHVCWSALFSSIYSLVGVGVTAVFLRLCRKRRNAEQRAAPNVGPATRSAISALPRGGHRWANRSA
jgi:hypothetical protein